jgi:serine/threonine protein kinase
VEIAIRICETLAPAHRAGLVHGGLSTHSILVQESATTTGWPDPMVALADFGLLPALRPTTVARGQPWGRNPYLSPEQAAGEPHQPASDVYVIGSLIYEMLTGRPPFRASDSTILVMQHLRQEPPSLQVLMPDVPPALAQIVHQSLTKEPASRYRNAGQLAHVLRTQIRPQVASPDTILQPVPPQAPAPQHLVVPPPPADTWASGGVYDLDGYEDWIDEPAGADWLMIGLAVLALLAVLGLIPLWQTVYRRYAAPLPAPASSLHYLENQLLPGTGYGSRLCARLWSNTGQERVSFPMASQGHTRCSRLPHSHWASQPIEKSQDVVQQEIVPAGRKLRLSDPDLSPDLQTNNQPELDDWAIVWYNTLSLRLPRARMDS